MKDIFAPVVIWVVFVAALLLFASILTRPVEVLHVPTQQITPEGTIGVTCCGSDTCVRQNHHEKREEKHDRTNGKIAGTEG